MQFHILLGGIFVKEKNFKISDWLLGIIVCIIYFFGLDGTSGDYNMIYCLLVPVVLSLFLMFIYYVFKIKEKYRNIFECIGIALYDLVTLVYCIVYGNFLTKNVSITVCIVLFPIILIFIFREIYLLKLNK